MIPLSGKQKREHLKFLAEEQRKNAKMEAEESRKDQLHEIKLNAEAAKADQQLGFKDEEHEVKMQELGGPLAKVGKPLSGKPRVGGTRKLGGKPLGYAAGTTSIPRPAGIPKGTDTIPALLNGVQPIKVNEGEAIIPAPAAQNPKNKPIIKKLVNEGRMAQHGASRHISTGAGIQHFEDGTTQAPKSMLSRMYDHLVTYGLKPVPRPAPQVVVPAQVVTQPKVITWNGQDILANGQVVVVPPMPQQTRTAIGRDIKDTANYGNEIEVPVKGYEDGDTDVQLIPGLKREIARTTDPQSLLILNSELNEASGIVPPSQDNSAVIAQMKKELTTMNPDSDTYKVYADEINRLSGVPQPNRVAERNAADVSEIKTEISKIKDPSGPQYSALNDALARTGSATVPNKAQTEADKWNAILNSDAPPNAKYEARMNLDRLSKTGSFTPTPPKPLGVVESALVGKPTGYVAKPVVVPKPVFPNTAGGGQGTRGTGIVPIPSVSEQAAEVAPPVSDTPVEPIDVPNLEEVSYKLDWTGKKSGENEAKLGMIVAEAAADKDKGESWLKSMLADIYGGEDSLFSKKELSRFITVAAGSLLFGGRMVNGKYVPASLPGSLKYAGLDALQQSDKRVQRQELYKEKRAMAEEAQQAKLEQYREKTNEQRIAQAATLLNNREKQFQDMALKNDIPADVVQQAQEFISKNPRTAETYGRAIDYMLAGKTNRRKTFRPGSDKEVAGYGTVNGTQVPGYMHVDPDTGVKAFRMEDSDQYIPIDNKNMFFVSRADEQEKRKMAFDEIEKGVHDVAREYELKKVGGDSKKLSSSAVTERKQLIAHSMVNAINDFKGLTPTKINQIAKSFAQQIKNSPEAAQMLEEPAGMDKALLGYTLMQVSGSNNHLYDARFAGEKGYKNPSMEALTTFGNRVSELARAQKKSINSVAESVQNDWNSNKEIQKKYTDGSVRRLPGYSPMMQWLLDGMPQK